MRFFYGQNSGDYLVTNIQYFHQKLQLVKQQLNIIMMNNTTNATTWIFTNSTNKSMERYIGVECAVATPRRREDGHRVAFVHEPGNTDNWYFYTSTITSINKTAYPEKGYATLEIRTHNSVYYFYTKIV